MEIYEYRKDDALWNSAVEAASASSSSSTSQAVAAKAELPVKEEPSSSTSEAVAVRAYLIPVKEEPKEYNATAEHAVRDSKCSLPLAQRPFVLL